MKTKNYWQNNRKMIVKKLFFVLIVFFMAFGGYAQNRIPAWNMQGWGGTPARNSDVSYLLAWRERKFSSMVNYTIKLDNVPMGNISKPAIFVKVDSDYSTWSNFAETELHQWNYYEINNYVVLSFEMSFRVPDRYSIAGAKPGERIYFRYYLDPQDSNTESLVNNWANLEGPFYVFFLGNTLGNMNFYYMNVPAAFKSIGQTALKDARAALSGILSKGTYQAAVTALIRDYPNRETYVFPNIQRFQEGKYSLYLEAGSTW